MKTGSQNTQTWKEITKNMNISASNPIPSSKKSTYSTQYQITSKGFKIAVPTADEFFGDLKKAVRKQ